MGGDSNLRKSSIKACKQTAHKRRHLSSSKAAKLKTIQQKTLYGAKAAPRCDEGTKECYACKKIKTNPNYKHQSHHITCPRNRDYKKTDGGRIPKIHLLRESMDQELEKELNRKFEGDELHTLSNKTTQNDVNLFLAGSKRPVQPTSLIMAPGVTVATATTTTSLGTNLDSSSASSPFLVSQLKQSINYLMANPSHAMKMDSKNVPKVISAAIEALLQTHTIKCESGTNILKLKDPRSKAATRDLPTYKGAFPPGTLGFTFPRDDKTQQPDPNYSQLEGVTIYLVRWELNIPGIHLQCPTCTHGEMIHQQYDFKHHGFATALFDISGVTDWACSMTYKCNNCEFSCKGNDGRLLATLPAQFRNAYPVDPRYAIGGRRTHIKKTFSNVMDKLMITHGNGEQLSMMLHELRGDAHLDLEEEFYNTSKDTGKNLSEPLPSFEEWIGVYSPSPSDLRNMKDVAAKSKLVSTGVADKDRVRREMQAVGATTTVCNDHTYAFLKNYISDDVKNAKCGHTIGVDTGEIASVAIVPNEEQIHYAHQVEQFSRRLNVKPKVHVSDVCPKGTKLWKALFDGVTCRLGWFHFLQRITKTLRIEHAQYNAAINCLQECLYWFDVADLEAVKQRLEDGIIGTVKGENGKRAKCPSDKILSKAKKFRENVRVWSYRGEQIARNLMQWYERFQNNRDDKIGEDLFTLETEGAILEQIQNVDWVTDTLTKDELYLEANPGKKSKSMLPVFIGRRGAESKLEKGHHAIAHFANGGMRKSLADYLGMAGVAHYNRKIRHRARIARLDPNDRAQIPSAFHRAPHYSNHLRLLLINQLGKQSGLASNIHGDAEALPEDNGERFFSEYLDQQSERIEERGVKFHKESNRCLCRECGGKLWNPYAKKRTQPNALAPIGGFACATSFVPALTDSLRVGIASSVARKATPNQQQPLTLAPRPQQLIPQPYFRNVVPTFPAAAGLRFVSNQQQQGEYSRIMKSSRYGGSRDSNSDII